MTTLKFRCTKEQQDQWQACADACDLSLSAWIRMTLDGGLPAPVSHSGNSCVIQPQSVPEANPKRAKGKSTKCNKCTRLGINWSECPACVALRSKL